ncbi:mCG144532, partial [Mus musculus]
AKVMISSSGCRCLWHAEPSNPLELETEATVNCLMYLELNLGLQQGQYTLSHLSKTREKHTKDLWWCSGCFLPLLQTRVEWLCLSVSSGSSCC